MRPIKREQALIHTKRMIDTSDNWWLHGQQTVHTSNILGLEARNIVKRKLLGELSHALRKNKLYITMKIVYIPNVQVIYDRRSIQVKTAHHHSSTLH